VLIIDRDYNIENINYSGLSLLGKSKKEVVGKKCYQIVHGVDSPGEYCPFRKVLKTKKCHQQTYTKIGLGNTFPLEAPRHLMKKGK
jgi:transcriptional regulator with PAS, ATPase and Fis domain